MSHDREYRLSRPFRSIESIGELSLQQAIENLRPHPHSMVDFQSQVGFIGVTENFLTLLEKDDEHVSSLGFSHTDIADPLFSLLGDTIEKLRTANEDSIFLTYDAKPYTVTPLFSFNFQKSPFLDGTDGRIQLSVVNSKQENFFFSSLHPFLIARYGFYEGLGNPYRLDPEKIIAFFNLTKKEK